MSWCQSHYKLRKMSNYAREIETYSWNACQTVSHSHTTKNMNAAVSEWHKRAHQFCEIDFIQKVLMDVVDSNTDTENDSDLRYSEVPLKGKDKTLVKILGVVNTGRPLQVKYWGVTTHDPCNPCGINTYDDIISLIASLLTFVSTQHPHPANGVNFCHC